MKRPLTFLNYAFPPGHLFLFKDSGANTFRSEEANSGCHFSSSSRSTKSREVCGHLLWPRSHLELSQVEFKDSVTSLKQGVLHWRSLQRAESLQTWGFWGRICKLFPPIWHKPRLQNRIWGFWFLSFIFFFSVVPKCFSFLKKMAQKFPQSSNWYAWDGPSFSGRRRHWECVLEAWTRRQGSLGEGGRNATALKTWWKQRLMATHTSLVLWVLTMNAGSCFWLTSLIHHCVTWISHLNTFTLPYPSHLPHPNKKCMKGG